MLDAIAAATLTCRPVAKDNCRRRRKENCIAAYSIHNLLVDCVPLGLICLGINLFLL